MNIRGVGTDLLRLKLRILSDEDLWWLFLQHREESREFGKNWSLEKLLVLYPEAAHSGP